MNMSIICPETYLLVCLWNLILFSMGVLMGLNKLIFYPIILIENGSTLL